MGSPRILKARIVDVDCGDNVAIVEVGFKFVTM